MTSVFPAYHFSFNMSKRQLSLPSRSLCRNLFGSVDHEANATYIKRELEQIEETQKTRWNYDFMNDKPLKGNISWQVLPSSNVPQVYKTSDVKADSNASTSKDKQPPKPPTVTSKVKTIRKKSKVKLQDKKIRQKRITDFMKTSKQRQKKAESKVEHDSSTPTPMKRTETSS